ncbi:hypothetical protein CU044_6282 [Streptomyces sp. L-9-10]|uniref:hypothetical protein n=1 Tax=Streptomyces sp. L-9-10 TaxID=1478131 RepID=UPI0010F03D64|nr:hypothetical protein [Streptomyces sp. L-9-10]RYJ21898.1 hypothetical protein CU044_6282 [Streptomyces sp. L-9-10]
MPGNKSDLKSLRATKYTSSLRRAGAIERLRGSGFRFPADDAAFDIAALVGLIRAVP